MTELSIEDLDTIAGGDTPPGPPGEYWTTPTGTIFVPSNWDPAALLAGPKPKPQPQPILFQD
jgi:hypothetical protein